MQPAIEPALELFFSYAHEDREFRHSLEKHLSALVRSGLIRTWHDGEIQAGQRWNDEIAAALNRAGIVLLLVSSDFLASTFCVDFELTAALERMRAGQAIVIPVLLRPVDWQGTPLADLQMLPTGARAVTEWPDRDAAFRDVAEHIREAIYGRRKQPGPQIVPRRPPVGSDTAERMLDAALPALVTVGEPADLVAVVRLPESEGLRAILRVDRNYSATPEDVRSGEFEVEFRRDAAGKLRAAALEIALEAPGFDPPRQVKRLRVPPSDDSEVLVFLLTPVRQGRLAVTLDVRYEDATLGSSLLRTQSATSAQPVPAAYVLASVPLQSTARVAAERHGDLMQNVRVMPPPQAPSLPPGPLPRSGTPKRSSGTLWKTLTTTAAGLLLMIGVATLSRQSSVQMERRPEQPVARPGPVVPVQPTPAPPSKGGERLAAAALHIATVPAGARIHVDNRDSCVSPCTLTLAPGSHTLTIRHPGFRQVRRVVTVPATRELEVTLEPLP